MKALRLAWLFFRVGAMNELQYRANFFIQLFQSTVSIVTGLVVLGPVFADAGAHGWSRPELLVVIGVQILIGGVIRTAIQPNMERLMDDVRDGKLDYALTKPEDSQVLISVREVRIWQIVDVFGGIAVLAYGISGLERPVGPSDVLLFLAMLLVGAITIYCFWLVITTLAFWIVPHGTSWSSSKASTRRAVPGVDLSGWLRFGVTFLVPIAFAITVPAEGVTSRLEWETVALALGFCAALFAFTRWWWRFGLRHYTGASA